MNHCKLSITKAPFNQKMAAVQDSINLGGKTVWFYLKLVGHIMGILRYACLLWHGVLNYSVTIVFQRVKKGLL